MDSLAAYVGFNLTLGIGPARLRRLIERCGSAAAAWRAPAAELRAAGLDSRAVAAVLEQRDTLDLGAALALARSQGAALCCWESDDYPAMLRLLDDGPPLLYIHGALTEADRCAVAIVGTRGPTAYGKEAARSMAGELAAAGVTVISGLAAGIDTAAHTAALEAGGRTIAVLAGGARRIYPAGNRRLAQEIAERGALVTEYPPDQPPLAGNFPARNRLISGLSLATIVVEAGERSGALITAQFALDQGREVCAVPGPIFSGASVGTHQLIRQGACLVRGAQDVLELLQLSSPPRQQPPAPQPETLSEAALLAELSAQPVHVDALVRVTGIPAGEVAATLALLEIKGLARHSGGMCYVAAAGARPVL